MAFKTGKTRSLTFSGTISGAMAFGSTFSPPAFSSFPLDAAHAHGTVSCMGFSFAFTPTGPTFDGLGRLWWGIQIDLNVVSCGISDSATASQTQVFGPYPTGGSVNNVSLAGSFSVTFDNVEEWISYGEGPSWPTFGGTAPEDPPGETKLDIYEVVPVGTNVTLSFNCNGQTINRTYVTTLQGAPAYDMVGSLQASNAAYTTSGGGTAVEHASCVVVGSLPGAGTGVVYSRSNGGAVCSVTGLTMSVDCPAGSSPTAGDLTCDIGSTKSYSLAGELRAWDGAYPSALTLKVDRKATDLAHAFTVGGSFSDSADQRMFSASCIINAIAEGDPSLSPVAVNEWCDVKMWIDPASLTAAGDDSTDWRVMQRGHRFAGLTTSQAAALVVDDGSATSPGSGAYRGAWTGSGSTITSSGGEIRIDTGAGGSNSATRSFIAPGTGAGLSGYRYLRIKIRSDAVGRPFAVMAAGKIWHFDYAGADLRAGIAPGTLYLDLCAHSADTDATDTRWPLPTADGALWGVTAAPTIVISSLDPSASYWIDEIALCRHPASGASKLTCMPAFKHWVLEVPPVVSGGGSVTTTTYARRFLQADTDGRLSLEEADYLKTVITSSGSPATTYGAIPIGSMVGGIGGAGNPAFEPNPKHAGWSASGTTVATDPADGGPFLDWLNCNRPALWLYGGGAFYGIIAPDAVHAWHFGIDLDANSARAIPAQALYDIVSWYPGVGDIFGHLDAPSGGTEIVLRAAKVLRGQSWGLAVTPAGGQSGQTVALKKHSTGVQEASALTDAKGEYFTGSSWAREDENYDTVGPTGTITRVMAGRYRYRGCFGVAAGKLNPFAFADRPGIPNWHATSILGKRAVYSRSKFQSPSGGWDVDGVAVYAADGAHAVADLRVIRDGRQSMIALFTVSALDGSAPNVWRSTSDDDGATWNMPTMQIPGGRHPTNAIGSDGALQIVLDAAFVENVDGGGASLHTGGVIKARRQGAGDATFGDVFTFLDSTGTPIHVADDTFQLSQMPEGPARWLLHCLEFGASGTSHWMSSDECETWTKVI